MRSAPPAIATPYGSEAYPREGCTGVPGLTRVLVMWDNMRTSRFWRRATATASSPPASPVNSRKSIAAGHPNTVTPAARSLMSPPASQPRAYTKDPTAMTAAARPSDSNAESKPPVAKWLATPNAISANVNAFGMRLVLTSLHAAASAAITKSPSIARSTGAKAEFSPFFR